MMHFSLIKGSFLLLMFVLSIEGTIALRNSLMSLIVLYLLFNQKILVSTYREILSSKELSSIVSSLLIFLLFVLLHSFFKSTDLFWSLDEWRAHLLYPVIYFFVGIMIANLVVTKKIASPQTFITAIFFSLFLHIIYIDLVGLESLIENGSMIRRYGGFMESPTTANYLTNILIAILSAEYVYRLRNKECFLKLSNAFLHLAMLACIFSTFIESLRLGDISLFLLGVSAAIIFSYKNNTYSKNHKRSITALIIFTLSIPITYNLNTDPRWGKLIETIPVAIETAQSHHWINKALPAPRTKSGYEVSGSNYERVAWSKKAIDYIYLDPLGIGFGRNAFGHAMQIYQSDIDASIPRGQTSHSSILDLTIGIGIFGTILWVFFIFKIAIFATNIFIKSNSYFSIITIFITIGYFSRGLVDANLRDHMFLQFMLLLGIILFFLFSENKKNEKDIHSKS